MKFEYPVDGISNPDHKLGCSNIVGTYPVGRLFNWHGGIHLAENSSSPIKAIADGTVIAYHIPETVAEAGDNKYSNGFVLIQHNYKSPKGRELVFYSLYSSLMPFDEMKTKKTYPEFFYAISAIVKGTEIKNDKTGENLRKKSNKSSKKGFVFNDSKVIVGNNGKKVLKNYYELVKIDGKDVSDTIIWSESLPTLEKGVDAEIGKIVSGKDIKTPLLVKAGQVIGFAGPHGFKNHENYRTAHVEVFTDIDPTNFLTGIDGKKDDVKDTKKYLRFAKGSKLSLKYPIKFCSGDEIEVLEFPEGENEEYCRIKLHKQIRDVDYEDLKFKEKNAGSELVWAKYTPKKLSPLNNLFANCLQKDSILNWVESLADSGGKMRRKVSFTLPPGDHIYWVKKETAKITAKPANPFALTADLTELYKRKPGSKLENELGEDYFIESSRVKKVKQAGSDQFFYEIKTMTPVKDDNGFARNEEVQGFIKSDDSNITKVSAHDWNVFGFEIFKDQEDEFVFNRTVEKLEESNAPDFLKTIWKQIDNDGNKNLSRRELVSGLKDEFVLKKFSKMICYHISEWGVDSASLKSEIETLLDEGINKEENVDKKNELSQKKELTLTNTKKKVEDLHFWSEVKIPIPKVLPGMPDDCIYDPILDQSRKRYPWELNFEANKEAEKEYTPFPKSNKVFHFHPVAFVEQMRRMGGCFCDRDLTTDDLVSLGISEANAEKYLNAINSTIKNYSINSCKRKLHFLAQLRHESGEFVYKEELASGRAYEGRDDLGNTETGDGIRFKGRGLIQITGRNNYSKYGTFKGMDFTKEPDNKKMGELPYCVDSAGWYWSENLPVDLNDYADKDDIIYITYRINGGFNGYISDRKPKLVKMIKATKCNNTIFENYDTYSIKNSKAWDSYDAVYKYASLNTLESNDSYKRFIELTDNYLDWNSMKGKKNKKKRENIESKRNKANEKSK